MNTERSKFEPAEDQVVKSGLLEWQPLDEPGVSGVFVKPLRRSTDGSRSDTILLKFDAGSTYPVHEHPSGEEIFVLDGDIHVGNAHLFTGDYLYTAPGGIHAVRAVNSCTILVKTPEEVVILKRKAI